MWPGRASFRNSSPLCKDMHCARIYTLCLNCRLTMSTQKTKRNVPPNNLNNIPRLKRNTLLSHLCTWECQTCSIPFPVLKRKYGVSIISTESDQGASSPSSQKWASLCKHGNYYLNILKQWDKIDLFLFLWPSFCYQSNTRITSSLSTEWIQSCYYDHRPFEKLSEPVNKNIEK